MVQVSGVMESEQSRPPHIHYSPPTPTSIEDVDGNTGAMKAVEEKPVKRKTANWRNFANSPSGAADNKTLPPSRLPDRPSSPPADDCPFGDHLLKTPTLVIRKSPTNKKPADICFEDTNMLLKTPTLGALGSPTKQPLSATLSTPSDELNTPRLGAATTQPQAFFGPEMTTEPLITGELFVCKGHSLTKKTRTMIFTEANGKKLN